MNSWIVFFIILLIGLIIFAVMAWFIGSRADKPIRYQALPVSSPTSYWHQFFTLVWEWLKRSKAYLDRQWWRWRQRRQGAYWLPWVLLLGDNDSGRHSLLASLQRQQQLLSHEDCWGFSHQTQWDWLATDLGVLVTLPQSEEPIKEDWEHHLKHLVVLRSERPLDGVVVVISVPQLLMDEPLTQTQQIKLYQYLLHSLPDNLGFQLPVYVLLSQTDVLPGFSLFWQELDEAHQGEMVGWSNPYPVGEPFNGEWCEESLAAIRQGLEHYLLQRATSGELESADEVFLFAEQFNRLQTPLMNWLVALFGQPEAPQGLLFRGLYCCGSVEAAGHIRKEVRSDVWFLSHLFGQKCFSEKHLAQPSHQGIWQRDKQNHRWRWGFAIGALLLAAGLTVTSIKLQQQVDTVVYSLKLLQQPSQNVQNEQGCTSKATVFDLLDHIARLDTHMSFVAIPLSWVDNRVGRQTTRYVAEQAFAAVIFPSMACHLRHNIEELASQTLPTLGADKSPEHLLEVEQALISYTQKWQELEKNLALFREVSEFSDKYHVDKVFSLFEQLTDYVFGEKLPISSKRVSGLHRAALANVIYQEWPSVNEATRILVSQRITEGFADWQQNLQEALNLGENWLRNLRQTGARDQQQLLRLASWLTWIDQQWLASGLEENNCEQLRHQWLPHVKALEADYEYPLPSSTFTARLQPDHCDLPIDNRLLAMQVSPYGHLFINGPKGGIYLADALKEEVAGFYAVSELDYFTIEPKKQMQCPATLRGWNAQPLQTLLTALREYQQFMVNRKLELQQTDLPLYASMAKDHLQGVSEHLLTKAQLTSRLADTMSNATSNIVLAQESLIINTEQQFKEVLSALLLIMGQLQQVQLIAQQQALSQCIQQFALAQLQDIKLLAVSSKLYEPKVNPQQPKNTDQLLYNLGDQSKVQEFLQQQWQRSQIIVGYTTPYLFVLNNTYEHSGSAGSETVKQFWRNTINEMQAYQVQHNDKGEVGKLNGFIANQLSVLTLDNCSQQLTADTLVKTASDLYSRQYQQLEQHANLWCDNQQLAFAYEQYRELAQAFNSLLSGRYPFAQQTATDASLEAIQQFLSLYEQHQDTLAILQNLPIQNSTFTTSGELSDSGLSEKFNKNTNWKKVAAFLTQLDSVMPFFKTYLAEQTQQQSGIKLKLTFRAKPKDSPGSEQLISWALLSGNERSTYPNGNDQLSWVMGDPIQLDLTWATQSSLLPLVDPKQSATMDIVDERTARFAVSGQWSLFKWLQAFGTETTSTADEVLLSFRVPVKHRDQSTPQGESRLFLAMQARQAKDGQEQTLALPIKFPTQAPVIW
ncbi:type VI secretion system protein [Zooshikella sp. RANM57]|uniref:type VI secretion system protein n=1 Tax=Zooshikella sp. RANM57 TaxID=3425863 RepID=UPI003D6DADBE